LYDADCIAFNIFSQTLFNFLYKKIQGETVCDLLCV